MSEVAMPMSEEKKIDGFDEYELRDACRTLREAEKIKADAKKMKALQPFLKEEQEALTGLARLVGKADKLESEGR